MSTIEKFHCHNCGAEAGIAGEYSDDPDEYANQLIDDEQFREDWDRRHANCKPLPPREPSEYEVAIFKQPDPRIAQVERRRAKNRMARKSRRANR